MHRKNQGSFHSSGLMYYFLLSVSLNILLGLRNEESLLHIWGLWRKQDTGKGGCREALDELEQEMSLTNEASLPLPNSEMPPA